jgi:hypothetical protein
VQITGAAGHVTGNFELEGGGEISGNLQAIGNAGGVALTKNTMGVSCNARSICGSPRAAATPPR